jgi:DNA topoisomerase-1
MNKTIKAQQKLITLLITKHELPIEKLDLVYVSDKSMPIERCKEGGEAVRKVKSIVMFLYFDDNLI